MNYARHSLDTVEAVFANRVTTGDRQLDAELIYVQLRKTLELIAFATLSANRERYSAAREGFATEWNARRMLGFIRDVNPDFYPVPFRIMPSVPYQPDIQLETDFLTEEKFVQLYDQAAEILHFANPFSPKDYLINLTVEVPKWVRLIRQLLRWHAVVFPDDDSREGWLFSVPIKGKIQWSQGELAD